MHRVDTLDTEYQGIKIHIRYSLIYGHDEGWKLGKLESVRRITDDGYGMELVGLLSDYSLERIKESVAEDINRNHN